MAIRRDGSTFRLLLKALYTASINDDKKGVYVYCESTHYSKQLMRQCVDIALSYIPREELIINSGQRWITLPNNKAIYFRSLEEKRNKEKRRGIDWTKFDEMMDYFG